MGSTKNLGIDVGTSGGDWLFRQGELVLGPAPASAIVERLYTGELDGRTEIARAGNPSFRRLSEVDFFRVHLAKAEAKLRVDAAARSQEQLGRRKRNVKLIVVATVAMVVASGAAFGARYLAVHKPWKEVDPYADLISVEAPIITLARKHVAEEDLVEYPVDGLDAKARKVADRGPAGGDKPKLAASARADRASKPAKVADEEPDGLQTATFDRDGINTVVAAKQKTLFTCFVAEAQKQPGLSAKIPIEFVVGNDGRVTKVWVDHPRFKDGSLPACLLKELQKWPFKAYEGERATVGLSFKIGKGG